MTLQLAGELRQKLEHMPQRLAEDFPDANPDQVEREVEDVAEGLMKTARFGDFVPVLAYRYAREHLLDESGDAQPDANG
jgi:hypothetical protein